jgi:DNA-binding phage protein
MWSNIVPYLQQSMTSNNEALLKASLHLVQSITKPQEIPKTVEGVSLEIIWRQLLECGIMNCFKNTSAVVRSATCECFANICESLFIVGYIVQ